MGWLCRRGGGKGEWQQERGKTRRKRDMEGGQIELEGREKARWRMRGKKIMQNGCLVFAEMY